MENPSKVSVKLKNFSKRLKKNVLKNVSEIFRDTTFRSKMLCNILILTNLMMQNPFLKSNLSYFVTVS